MPTTPPAPPGVSRLAATAAQFQHSLEQGDQAASDALVNAWAGLYATIRQDIDALAQQVEQARQNGTRVSPSWLYRQQRYKIALDTAKRELARYSATASEQVVRQQASAVRAGLAAADRLARQAVAEALPGLQTTFLQPDVPALHRLLGHLATGGPLDDLLNLMPVQVNKQLRDALVQSVALGRNAQDMARRVEQVLQVPRWRAVTILRTESQRAYRAAHQAVYEANPHVLSGWVWRAHLDARTCSACVIMDGTEHPVTETLDGHPRCRCAMVPRTVGWEDLLGPQGRDLPDTRPPVRSGKAWLEDQPEAVQKALLGKGKFDAWKAGQISLDDMVARPHSADWGSMRRERSLSEIRRGVHPNGPLPPSTPPSPPAPPSPRTPPTSPAPAAPAAPAAAPAPKIELPTPTPPPTITREPRPTVPDPPAADVSHALLMQMYHLDKADKAERTAAERLAEAERVQAEGYADRAENLRASGAEYAASAERARAEAATYQQTLDHAQAWSGWYARNGLADLADAGGYRLGTPMDAKAALEGANPGYGSRRAYGVNCTHCVTTDELRRRGLDVVATPLPEDMVARGGRNSQEIVSRWRLPDGTRPQLLPVGGITNVRREVKDWPEGGRGWVVVRWKGGGGHIYCVERGPDGKPVFTDPQEASRNAAEFIPRAQRGGVYLVRIDNAVPTEAISDLIQAPDRPLA